MKLLQSLVLIWVDAVCGPSPSTLAVTKQRASAQTLTKEKQGSATCVITFVDFRAWASRGRLTRRKQSRNQPGIIRDSGCFCATPKADAGVGFSLNPPRNLES